MNGPVSVLLMVPPLDRVRHPFVSPFALAPIYLYISSVPFIKSQFGGDKSTFRAAVRYNMRRPGRFVYALRRVPRGWGVGRGRGGGGGFMAGPRQHTRPTAAKNATEGRVSDGIQGWLLCRERPGTLSFRDCHVEVDACPLKHLQNFVKVTEQL